HARMRHRVGSRRLRQSPSGRPSLRAPVSGLSTIEGTPAQPKSPPIIPICDNVVGWLGTVGILAALCRRAIEGGSYRVTVSLTRTVLWLMSTMRGRRPGRPTETPLGTYQGMTDQVVLSRTPGSFRTVLVPRGSSKPEWLVPEDQDGQGAAYACNER